MTRPADDGRRVDIVGVRLLVGAAIGALAVAGAGVALPWSITVQDAGVVQRSDFASATPTGAVLGGLSLVLATITWLLPDRPTGRRAVTAALAAASAFIGAASLVGSDLVDHGHNRLAGAGGWLAVAGLFTAAVLLGLASATRAASGSVAPSAGGDGDLAPSQPH